MSQRTCSIGDCTNKLHSKELCRKHYRQFLNEKYGHTCEVSECNNPHHQQGYCHMHYRRWKKHGNAHTVLPTRNVPVDDRFESLTRDDGDCIVWTGALKSDGYGQFHYEGKTVSAHRFSWEHENGEIPHGMQVDHVCWNRRCVKPDHLRLVEHHQNSSYREYPVSTSSSGHRNVYSDKGKWRVQIHKGVTYYFGLYDNLEDAIAVAERERRRLFGDFAGRG